MLKNLSLRDISSDYSFNSQKFDDNMHNLKIKNFGPIKKAEIDLAPLTIFVGRNNSGKSYLSGLIHSIFSSIDDIGEFGENSIEQLLKNDNELFEDFNNSLLDYLNSKPNFFKEPFKYDAKKFDKLFCEGIEKLHLLLIENNLKNNFVGNLNMLNNGGGNGSFEITFDKINFVNDNGKLKIKNSKSITQNKIKLKNKMLFEFNRQDDEVLIKLDYLTLSKLFKGYDMFSIVLYSTLAHAYGERQKEKSFYIPASGQSTTDKFKSILSDELSGIRMTSNIEKDLLFSYLNHEREVKNKTFYEIASGIEKDILNGEIKFRYNGVYDELIFQDNVTGCEFDFNLVSSSIKQLTPLINYLKYELDVGDTLIIEEIENHLHPQNQRILVRNLVNLVNNGLNIVLTTHSDYVLEQFNNLIRLSNVGADDLKGLGFGAGDILDCNDVNIYNFKNDLSLISKFDINSTGFVDEVFYDVIEDLYDESREIIRSKER